MDTKTLRVIDIVDGTIVDGPGLRTSIYFAGCRHKCPGCHNPQSWDFNAGRDMSIADLVEHVRENDFDVTLSGGDPMYQIDNIILLSREIHKLGHTVWLYTGYTIEEIRASESLSRILTEVDAIVEGPFVQSLRDLSLQYRGSSNQRIITLSDHSC